MNMLKNLTEEEFVRRTRGGFRTPVYREFLADRETPVAVLSRAADDDGVFLLESVAGGESVGRYSYLGVDPVAVVAAQPGEMPLAAVKAALSSRPFAPAPELPPLQGGAIGYLAYDAVKAFSPRVKLAPEPGTPSSAFLLTDTMVVFDHVRQTAIVIRVTSVEADETPAAAYRRAQDEIAAVYARLLSAESIAKLASGAGGLSPARQQGLSPFRPEMRSAPARSSRSCRPRSSQPRRTFRRSRSTGPCAW